MGTSCALVRVVKNHDESDFVLDNAFIAEYTAKLADMAHTAIIQDANFVDIITDERENSSEIDAQLQSLAERLIRFSVKGYIKPHNFLGVGGHKIFRDNVWGRLRPIWQADHRYYKKHGWYDFPQKDIKVWILNPILMSLSKIPKFRKGFYANVKKFPAKRYGKLIEKII